MLIISFFLYNKEYIYARQNIYKPAYKYYI